MLCVAWLEANSTNMISTCFLTFFALVFIELMYFQPTFIDADEQVIQILEQNHFEKEQLLESTVSLAFPWQHTIKSRQNWCLCKSVKSLFELFHHFEDLEWGPHHQAQQVDAKNEICIEISYVDAIKGKQFLLNELGHHKHSKNVDSIHGVFFVASICSRMAG